jgi:NAD(P)-dependent dehydrogenase (short-subunit alcohol dehydrogenase family)
MNGKTVLITGATNGIGKEMARALAKQGAAVVIVGRSRERTAATAQAICAETPAAQVDTLLADLSSLAEVRALAAAFRQRHGRLDVLINNAGAFFQQRQETADGFELTFALNHLSYFLLTTLLLDMLQASGRPGAAARIINVSSSAHQASALNFDDLHSRQKYAGFSAYGRSKLANVLFTYELARRLTGQPVTANAMHPGFVATGFASNNGGIFKLAMKALAPLALTPEKGAQTGIYLASSPEVEGVTGKYFHRSRAKRSSAVSYDEAAQRRLWERSEAMVNG